MVSVGFGGFREVLVGFGWFLLVSGGFAFCPEPKQAASFRTNGHPTVCLIRGFIHEIRRSENPYLGGGNFFSAVG